MNIDIKYFISIKCISWAGLAGRCLASRWYSLNGDKVLYLNIHLYMIRPLGWQIIWKLILGIFVINFRKLLSLRLAATGWAVECRVESLAHRQEYWGGRAAPVVSTFSDSLLVCSPRRLKPYRNELLRAELFFILDAGRIAIKKRTSREFPTFDFSITSFANNNL